MFTSSGSKGVAQRQACSRVRLKNKRYRDRLAELYDTIHTQAEIVDILNGEFEGCKLTLSQLKKEVKRLGLSRYRPRQPKAPTEDSASPKTSPRITPGIPETGNKSPHSTTPSPTESQYSCTTGSKDWHADGYALAIDPAHIVVPLATPSLPSLYEGFDFSTKYITLPGFPPSLMFMGSGFESQFGLGTMDMCMPFDPSISVDCGLGFGSMGMLWDNHAQYI